MSIALAAWVLAAACGKLSLDHSGDTRALSSARDSGHDEAHSVSGGGLFQGDANPGTDCNAPAILCADACTNIANDPTSCGACNARCPAGDTCAAGACSSTGCPGGLTSCGGLCVDLKTNPLSCGSCNNACTEAETCDSGSCKCPATHRVCSGVCADTSTSHDDCGACGNACAADEQCKNGRCEPRCASPLEFCDGRCVDLAHDATACGACASACAPLETCSSGHCACPEDRTHAVCDGTCVNTATNGDNCGGCRKVCPSGTHCERSLCTSCTGGFFFCPSQTGDPLTTCLAQAEDATRGEGTAAASGLSPDLSCQCNHCLRELQDCVGDSLCVSTFQCAMSKACTAPCWDAIGVCSMPVAADTTWACFKWCSPSTAPLPSSPTGPTGSPLTATRVEALFSCTRDNHCGI